MDSLSSSLLGLLYKSYAIRKKSINLPYALDCALTLQSYFSRSLAGDVTQKG